MSTTEVACHAEREVLFEGLPRREMSTSMVLSEAVVEWVMMCDSCVGPNEGGDFLKR